MNEKDFDLLCESIRQAGEIRRGVRKPSRTFVIEDPNPKAIRERLGLSQSRFASIIGVSVRTLQNWEQGRREPEGPAKALLRVVDREPQAVLHALHAQEWVI
jgi:putative transcriptional regulator